jgi:rhodanese-related sulfurtransferase
VSINTNSHAVTVVFDDTRTTVAEMQEKLADGGYTPESSQYVHTNLTPEEAKNMADTHPELLILDVREAGDFCDAAGHILHAVSHPWDSGVLEDKYEVLPLDGDILVVDADGTLSHLAANFLDEKGFTSVYDMEGGMEAWSGTSVACCHSFGLEGIIVALQLSVNLPAIASDILVRDVDGDGKIGVAEAACILKAASETSEQRINPKTPAFSLPFLKGD